MAHSLRSKSKLQAKSIKRKNEFSKYAEERTNRLQKKLEEHDKEQGKPKEDGGMDLDNKKVSTHGWRDSRSQIYKKLKHKKDIMIY
ncbi:hypothetical protein QCA50_012889 [Cerrena zonata]|uniref:DUF2423 domain-containing protein n=1 Tax=Cerrena zonata TaxID=2478898 RepID=A0AAW0FQG6_9APHY